MHSRACKRPKTKQTWTYVKRHASLSAEIPQFAHSLLISKCEAERFPYRQKAETLNVCRRTKNGEDFFRKEDVIERPTEAVTGRPAEAKRKELRAGYWKNPQSDIVRTDLFRSAIVISKGQ